MKRFFYHSMIAFAVVGMTLSCSPSKTLGPQAPLQLADNPFITHMYTADPSAHVWEDGRLYVYASHDIDPPAGCDRMDRYHVFSTDDMVNWTDHGEIQEMSHGDVRKVDSCGLLTVLTRMASTISISPTLQDQTGTTPGA